MKKLYVAMGCLTLALGVMGIFVPLLPTTPFLLLSAWFYCKGSSKLYGWLMAHPYLGTYIRNYRFKKSITLRTKIISMFLLWTTILICIFVVVDPLWLKIMLGVILVCVSWHLLSFKTMKSYENIFPVRIRTRKQYESAAQLAGVLLAEGFDSQVLESVAAENIGPNAVTGEALFLLKLENRYIGLLSVCVHEGHLSLDALYLLPDYRRRGYSKDILSFVLFFCKSKGLPTVRLLAERDNIAAGEAFGKYGFRIAETLVGDSKCVMEISASIIV